MTLTGTRTHGQSAFTEALTGISVPSHISGGSKLERNSAAYGGPEGAWGDGGPEIAGEPISI
jgi:hypothetical protein